ncbi:MAG: FmdB family zinc ribbon protein [Rubrivivax sp.]
MPIYAYRCGACGHSRDVLQKLSDPLLTTCPACGAEAFSKQVTAAGFQLKGSGWYVTDFRDNGSGRKAGGDAASGEPGAGQDASQAPAAAASGTAGAAGTSAPAPAPSAAAPASAAPASASSSGSSSGSSSTPASSGA